MSRVEWDSLEWWEQRLYLDGLRAELGGEESGDASSGQDDSGESGDLSKLQGFGVSVKVV